MIVMNYDAQGKAISDFEIEDTYRYLKNMVAPLEGRIVLHYSTENIFHRVRQGLAEGELKAESVLFIWNAHFMNPRQNGTIPDWPNGFLDASLILHEHILTAQVKLMKKSRDKSSA